MEYKKYNNIKLFVGISKAFISFFLVFIFIASGWSKELETYIRGYTNNSYLVLLLFVAVTGIVSGILFFPLNFYSQYILEHKYKLSNQNIGRWLFENIKGLLLSVLIGIPLLMVFYFSMVQFGNLWWLPFSIVIFLLSVILARIIPVLILPLFYKLTPFENEQLKDRIEKIASDAGIKIRSIYRFNMSKNTKKANAAFTGIGKSKRIILGDTLIDNYTEDEIETVIAHELGHYKKRHIVKNIIRGTILSFLTLFIIALLYQISVHWFGFREITDIAALPLMLLWSMLIGLIETPAGNYISRKYEYEADEYAVDVTRKPEAFASTLVKLTEQNLGDKVPHPFVEWFFYSHPSISNRLHALKEYSKRKFNIELADELS